MYNVIRQDDWDETIDEVIGSTDCYDEAQWMKQTAREDEPEVCFFIREDISEEVELAEKEAYKTKDIIEAHEKQIAHCDEKIRRELRELQANTKWLEDERERLLGTLDYLQRQVVLMA